MLSFQFSEKGLPLITSLGIIINACSLFTLKSVSICTVSNTDTLLKNPWDYHLTCILDFQKSTFQKRVKARGYFVLLLRYHLICKGEWSVNGTICFCI